MICLNFENFLIWLKQVISLLRNQNQYHIVDGSAYLPQQISKQNFGIVNSPCLSPSVSFSNPHFPQWHTHDWNVIALLLSSLFEEALSETLNADTAQEIWNALHSTQSSLKKTRELCLRDELQLMHRGSFGVTDYRKKFSTICDKLTAIGALVDNDDKVHWFLCAIGLSNANFSTSQLDQVPIPLCNDIMCKVES